MSSRPDFLKLCKAKLMSHEAFLPVKNQLKAFGKKIVFTNGCFDILHRGHLEYLMQAAAQGDFLVIGLNTDESVRAQNKSPERPINNEETRALQLGALHVVDSLLLFDESTPENLIRFVEPDILVKGSDYDAGETNPASKKYIIGSDFVKNRNGKVITIPLVEGFSTTSLIQKLKK
jgi:D-glycero-beta-D-manno-heptose 1-phosphate adenylyltransferase